MTRPPLEHILAGALVAFMIASPASATSTVCQKVGGAVAVAGTTLAGASTAVGLTGTTAVVHSSGGAILATYGAGGYVAGTLGTAGATALAFVSSPAVILTGAAMATVGVVGAGYCYFGGAPRRASSR
jgi:hypothetical protein